MYNVILSVAILIPLICNLEKPEGSCESFKFCDDFLNVIFFLACIQPFAGSLPMDEKSLNCENNLVVLLGNILLYASLNGDESIFIDDNDIATITGNSDELNEYIGRTQIYAEIDRIISSHDAKWIPYQSMSNCDDSKTTITSVERI